MIIMDSDLIKQSEWDCLAADEKDLGKQILRPFDKASWSLLAQDIVNKLELDADNISLIDVGCGNAYLLTFFADKLSHITGVDYAQSMIDVARVNIPDGSFHVGNASSVLFDDDSFDRTLCYSIFHYFRSDEQVYETIDNLIRITKPGGIVLIGDLLDNSKEVEIKSGSDLEIEATLPLIKRYSQWRFIDYDAVLTHLNGRVKKAGLLAQPETFQTSSYRKDLKIWV